MVASAEPPPPTAYSSYVAGLYVDLTISCPVVSPPLEFMLKEPSTGPLAEPT